MRTNGAVSCDVPIGSWSWLNAGALHAKAGVDAGYLLAAALMTAPEGRLSGSFLSLGAIDAMSQPLSSVLCGGVGCTVFVNGALQPTDSLVRFVSSTLEQTIHGR